MKKEELVIKLEKLFEKKVFSFREKEAIVIKERIKTKEVPEGYYTYPIRTGGWNDAPVTFEKTVVVNYYATLITKESLDDYLVEEGYSNLSSTESLIIQDYIE